VADSGLTLGQAVLGGGCFWCLEALFKRVDGVVSATSGYAGGSGSNPSYEQVCTGNTGHAEVVRLQFDTSKIDYEGIIRLFFASHDPTTVHRQGADVGSQYRSVILHSDPEQKRIAEKVIKDINTSRQLQKPIVTELAPLENFWKAEDHHQDYYEKHPYAGYCRIVIAPKLQKAGFSSDSIIS